MAGLLMSRTLLSSYLEVVELGSTKRADCEYQTLVQQSPRFDLVGLAANVSDIALIS